MAKFGATTAFDRVKARAKPSRSASVSPVVPDHGVHAVGGQPGQVGPGRLDLGEVHGHVHARVEQRLGSGGHRQVQVHPGDLAQIEAHVERVDHGHQLEVGIGHHRPAHLGAHPAAGAEDAHSHHGASLVVRLGPAPAGPIRRPERGRRPGRRRWPAPGRRRSNGPTTDKVAGRPGRGAGRRRPRPRSRPGASQVLFDGHHLAAGDQSRAQTAHAAAAVLQAQQRGALQVALGHGQLLVGDAVGQQRRRWCRPRPRAARRPATGPVPA